MYLKMNSRLPVLRMLIALVWMVPVCACFCWFTPIACAQTDERSDRLEAYLKSHGLNDLLIAHYHKQLIHTSEPALRQTIAEKLVTQYLIQIANSESSDQQTLIAKLEELTKQFPTIATLDVQLTLRRHQFLNSQAEFAQVYLTGTSDTNKNEIESDFEQLCTFYESTAKRLSDELKLLSDNESTSLDRNSDTLVKIETRLAEVTFYRAWSEYYFALLAEPNAANGQHIKQSERLFRDVLGIAQERPIDDVDSEWLDIESDVVCRAVAGLGMALAKRGDSKQRDACFEMLSDLRVPPEVVPLRHVWQFQAAAYARDLKLADSLASSYSKTVEYRDQSIEYWILIAQYAQTIKSTAPEQSSNLMQHAIAGSLRLGQFVALENAIEIDELDFDKMEAYGRWAQADMQFRAVEANEETDASYASVARLAEDSAEEFKENGAPAIDQARCLALAAWSYYRTRRWQTAADHFRTVYDLVTTTDTTFAADSLWMRIESLENIRNLGERTNSQWLAALDEYQRVFPHTKRAANARFKLTRAKTGNRSPDEIIAELQKTQKTDPNYAASQLEIARLYYQLWEDAASESAQQESQRDLQSFVSRLRKQVALPLEVRLKSAFLLNETYMRAGNVDQASKLLIGVAPLLESPDENDSIRAEYKYHLMQLARQKGETEKAEEHAREIVAINDQSPFAMSALTFLANQADQLLARANDANRKERLASAIDIYSRLSELMGNSQQAIKQNRNARIVLSKLASFRRQNGQPEKARELYESLLEAYPDSRTYLTEMAEIHTEQKQLEKGLELWNRLVIGTEEGSEPWYQAKYNQMLCLETTDRATAQKIMAQFTRLHPQPAEKWRQPIDELRSRLQDQ